MARSRHPFHHPRTSIWVDVVAERWLCPVCGAAADRMLRPGRPKIYCTNACRQRAYRARKATCARSRVTVDHPGQRAFTRHKSHALRVSADPLAPLSDRSRREITVCGLLAKPARRMNVSHYLFLSGAPGACKSCRTIVTTPDLVTGTTSDWHPHFPDSQSPERRRQVIEILARIVDWPSVLAA